MNEYLKAFLPIAIILPLTLIALKFRLLALNHNNLFRQKLFWVSIFTPLALFLYYGFWIWRDFSISMTYHGYNKSYEISKLPLLILASAVPLAAIINNIHRTIQTEKQISEAEKKNLSDSYYTHFKHTLDLFKALKSDSFRSEYDHTIIDLEIINPVALYSKIFYLSSPTKGVNYEINPVFKYELIRSWKRLNRNIHIISKIRHSVSQKRSLQNEVFSLFYIHELNESYRSICELLGLDKFVTKKAHLYSHSHATLISNFFKSHELQASILQLKSISERVLDIINNKELTYAVYICKDYNINSDTYPDRLLDTYHDESSKSSNVTYIKIG